uniref:Uncharacterized protein n=1 Tax=Dicentrarchus labrax TaxID=13489 RepID=A0A8P4G391_DICLA
MSEFGPSICIVPDFTGFPPSTAVNVSLIIGCFSRSKAFCSTNSADALSPPLLTSMAKCSLGLNLYVFTELLPVSESWAIGSGYLSPDEEDSDILNTWICSRNDGALSFMSIMMTSMR